MLLSPLDYLKATPGGTVTVKDLSLHLYDVVLEHPLGAILVRHELSHLLTFDGSGRRGRIFHWIFRGFAFAAGMEKRGFGEQYDFTKKHVSKEMLDRFKEETHYRSPQELLDWARKLEFVAADGSIDVAAIARAANTPEITDRTLQFIAMLQFSDAIVARFRTQPEYDNWLHRIALEKLNLYLVTDVERVHTLTRDEYIQFSLKRIGLTSPYKQIEENWWPGVSMFTAALIGMGIGF